MDSFTLLQNYYLFYVKKRMFADKWVQTNYPQEPQGPQSCSAAVQGKAAEICTGVCSHISAERGIRIPAVHHRIQADSAPKSSHFFFLTTQILNQWQEIS